MSLPFLQRREFLPVLRYGNFAGPGYGGGMGAEDRVNPADPASMTWQEYTRTPAGLIEFMQRAERIAPVDYLDAVTKNHDIDYAVAELRFMDGVQSQFGKLPHELSAEERGSAAFAKLSAGLDRERFGADKVMLLSTVAYWPDASDPFAAEYRKMIIAGFYEKAASGVFGYGLPEEMNEFFNTQLKALDPSLSLPSAFSTLTTASRMAQAGLEDINTSGLTGFEKQLFNQHLPSLQYLQLGNLSQDGALLSPAEMDYENRIVTPVLDSSNRWVAEVTIAGRQVLMILTRDGQGGATFTREVREGGALVEQQEARKDALSQDDYHAAPWEITVRDATGAVSAFGREDPRVFLTPRESPNFALKLDAIRSGDLSALLGGALSDAPVRASLSFGDPADALAALTGQATISTLGAGAGAQNPYGATVDAWNSLVVGTFGSGIRYVADLNGGWLLDAGEHVVGWTAGAFEGNPILGTLDGRLLSLDPNGAAVSLSLNTGATLPAFKRAGFADERLPAVAERTKQQIAMVQDVASLMEAIKSGNPLPTLSSGVRLLNSIDRLDGTRLPYLDQATQVVGGIASLYSLANALENGDGLDQLVATASALKASADALVAVGLLDKSNSVSQLLGASGAGAEAVPCLGLIVSIKNGDAVGTVSGALGLLAPELMSGPVGWALAAVSIIKALNDEPPEAWGIAKPVFEGDALYDSNGKLITTVGVDVVGDSFGTQRARSALSAALGYLQATVDEGNAAAGREAYGLIPQRLSPLAWREGRQSDPGYAITEIDPLTGEQRYPFLRWDDDGYAFSSNPALYQVDPLDPQTRGSFSQRLVVSALERGAIAPLWEVQTARLQQQAGDPYAGLTEAERAGRGGHLAAFDPSTGRPSGGQFRPVALDLDHSGSLGLVAKDAAGNDVAFDWDDSGYLKETAWLGQGDGFLFIDRNANGKVDAGSELFSNSALADSFKGVRSMAWVDADGDGLLSATDPVFNQLRVWQDLNADGDNVQTLGDGSVVEDEGEIRTLAQLGITQLDYANSRFSQSGGLYSMASPLLEAENRGTRVNVVQGGIFIENSDGVQRLVITQVVSAIDGSDTVQAFEDGALGPGESRDTPRPIDIAHSLLLANDSTDPSGLTISAVMNAVHGSVELGQGDQAGFVVFTSEPDFHGEARFQYLVTDAQGHQRTFDVTVALASVNDDPIVTSTESAGRAVYGYLPLGYSYTQYVYAGEDLTPVVTAGTALGDPIYAPYVEEIRGAPIYELQQVGEDNQMVLVGYQPSTFVDHGAPLAMERATTGLLQASDADGPSSFSYELLMDGQYGRAAVNPDGTWSYEAYRPNGVAVGDINGDQVIDYANPDTGEVYITNPGNGYLDNRYGGSELQSAFLDSFTVRVTSDSGGVRDKAVEVIHYGPRPLANVESGSKKPIAIDLDGDGFRFIDVDDSNVFFDVNGDGWRRRTSWIGPQDGLLAIDRDGDGKITSGKEIAFIGDKSGSQTDLEGLAAFDTNGDGLFSAADRDWSSFGVWRDANGNGVTDAGEFRLLDDLGITSIGLSSDGRFRVIDGQSVHGLATVTTSGGGTLQAADVSFRWTNEVQTRAADGSTGVVSAPRQHPGQTFNGTPGKDLVLGTEGSDSFLLGAGDDVMVDDAGNDQVEAGDGNDLVYTGQGNDAILLGNGDDTAYAGEGNDVVFGDGIGGTGNDLILLQGGNDVAFGGDGADCIAGGDGNDVISGDGGDDKLFGEAGWDALFGKAGDDELWGMEGNDQLDGGDGDDLMAGGAGDDQMEGGAGDDLYEVDSAADVVTERPGEGQDTVRASLDYTLADTLENLTLTGPAGLQGTGNAEANVLVGNDADNLLYGLGGEDVLDGGAGADRMDGGEGDDTYVVEDTGDMVVEAAGNGSDTVRSRLSLTLAAEVEKLVLIGIAAIDGTGNELDNEISGNAAANRIDGGLGADRMAGGRGDDVYVVRNAGDRVIEADREGYDTVLSHLAAYALEDNIEALVLASGAVRGQGNALANTMLANGADNTLDGGGGADTMTGGAGDDLYVVDDAADQVVEDAGGGNDTVWSTVTYGLAANTESLALQGAVNIDGTGNAAANTLLGNAGSNLLDGGAGADRMAGGLGDDSYIVDDPGDLVIEQSGEGFDRVASGIDYALTDHLEQLLLTGSAVKGRGNDLDNLLFGNDLANLLDGARGADQMAGGLGDDRYAVDDLADAVAEGLDAGLDTVIASVDYSLGVNVENLVLTGTAMSGTGNDDANVLAGNAQANLLVGGAGHDVLAGGFGDDRLDGGTGDDLFLYHQGEGRDVITDAAGTDTLRFGAGITLESVAARTVMVEGQSRVYIALLGADGNEQQGQGVELADASSIERFEFGDGTAATLADLMIAGRTWSGTSGNDTLTGDRRDDILYAGGGADLMYGRWGNDVLYGGVGADVLFGEGGNDRLYGETEGDRLWGGAGDDMLSGGSGNDQLVGGAGQDELLGGEDADLLDGGGGADSLLGGSGEDQLFGGAGNDTLDGGVDADLLAAGEGDDVVHAGSAGGVNVVIAGAGQDAIDSGTDRDFIDAGSGNDTITSGASSDFVAAGAGNDVLNTGADRDLIAFNRGDGSDLVVGSGWDRDTLSLGGGIAYADLSLRKSGSDLVVELGQGESITFQGWYTSNDRRSVDTLQVATAGGDYDASSADRIKNRKVIAFDFAALVNRFDQLRAGDPNLVSWPLAGDLNGFFKAGSDSAAMGGDMAYRYATNGRGGSGSYGDLDWTGIRTRMGDRKWIDWQPLVASTAMDPWAALQAGTSLLADATLGLPSPITPTAAPTSEELAFAALTAGGRPPSWMGNAPGPLLP